MTPKSDSARPSRSHSTKPSSSSAQPYPHSSQRRSPSQPKSTRQQFSACGACRMRRVRCDLKDLQAANPSAGHSSCSNCQERGLRCVDEFAEVKAVKLLRRGRRLQQVEAVYGKAALGDTDRNYLSNNPQSSPSSPIIPKLRAEFFSSPFFLTLLIQRPIIEPVEFSTRFMQALKGDVDILGPTGQLICMALAVWAVSFGVNELGEPEPHAGHSAIRQRKERTNEMIQDLLRLIDNYGILRKPTWDGVRVLLLVIPLTEDVQTPMERLSMYEATINQVYTLCSLANVSSVNSGQGEAIDAAVRARIFWYAHVHEGVTTGLRGGRLLLSDEDLVAFQRTLPPLPGIVNNYTIVYRFSKTPMNISSTCRKVHAALTGPKSRQRGEIDENRLHEAWNELDRSWRELDTLRRFDTMGLIQPTDVERFVNGWQILIFECYNVIREALKQRLTASSNEASSSSYLPNDASTAPGGGVRSPRTAQIAQLLSIAETKCHEAARSVVGIVHQHVSRKTSFFAYDASLSRDGLFFAGLFLAEAGSEADGEACLQALREMRWAFSKCEEREQALKMVWTTRRSAQAQAQAQASDRTVLPSGLGLGHGPYGQSASGGRNDPPSQDSVTTSGLRLGSPYGTHLSHGSTSVSPPLLQSQSRTQNNQPQLQLAVSHSSAHHRSTMRPLPPPLTISHATGVMIDSSAPTTATSDDATTTWMTSSLSNSSSSQGHGSNSTNNLRMRRTPPSVSGGGGSPPYLPTSSGVPSSRHSSQSHHSHHSLILSQPSDHSVYFQVSDVEPFAYSVTSSSTGGGGPSTSSIVHGHSHTGSDSQVHELITPPRSSTGLPTSTSSTAASVGYTNDSYYDTSSVFQVTSPAPHPPPSRESDVSSVITSDDAAAVYHSSYTSGQFFIQ